MATSRVGETLKSARARAGWSRDALAFHAGLSSAAIAQIESGRRQEVRISSLVALAKALGVSVDYLVGAAAVSPRLLGHLALIYDSDEQFLAAALPFVVEGASRSDGVLVVTAPRRLGLLRDAIGDVGVVEFIDWSAGYDSPTGALNRYRAFVTERSERGAPWVRILGEPLWAGRTDTEVEEWIRYESMINLSFATLPATIICPYDARSVPDRVLAGARCTHPEVADPDGAATSLAYREPEDLLLRARLA